MFVSQDMMVDFKATIKELLQSRSRTVVVEFADGKREVNRRYTIFYLHFWWILIKWGVPVTSEFMLNTTVVTNKTISSMYTQIYEAVIDKPNYMDVRADMWVSINELHNFVLVECGEYHASISILELCKLMKEPKIKKIIDGCNFDLKTSSSIVEDKVRKGTAKMIKLLKDKKLPNNVLWPFHHLSLINNMQIPQMMLAIGIRTDINDTIIQYPIKSNFIQGLKNPIEYMAESLTAKIAAVYNKDGIPKSQYFSRRQHFVSGAILHQYPGDCGTQLTVPYYVYDKAAKNLEGKIHVVDGKHVMITKENCDELIGHTINLRSPITCRHVDGTCEVCGGKMTKYLTKDIKLGMASIIEVTNVITQMILSVKHLQNTRSVVYTPPAKLRSVLITQDDKIFWHPQFAKKVQHCKLGIPLDNIAHISDLNYIKNTSSINVEHFSRITQMAISTIEDNKEVVKPLSMSKGKIFPYFSKEMLLYIKENYEELIIGDVVWIPLDKFDDKAPIFQSLILNDSMMAFVDHIERFLKTTIGKYTSVPEALKDLSSSIYKKVSTNILHIEIMLKAYLITSELDYGIPVVDDLENVKFGTDNSININRSLGCFLAYERFFPTIKQPSTFVVPKRAGTMDTYLGFSDKVFTRRGPVQKQ